MFRRGVFVGVLISLSFGADAQKLAGKDRSDFAEAMSRQCYSAQRASQVNSALQDSAIRGYCSCTANKFADALTIQDMQRFAQIGRTQGTQAAQRELTASVDVVGIGMECAQSYMQR